MVKADIVKVVAEQLHLKDRDALKVVDDMIGCMKTLICRHGRIELRNFGVFEVKKRKARVGRNPKNKIEYPIEGHRVVTFKGGKGVREVGENGDE